MANAKKIVLVSVIGVLMGMPIFTVASAAQLNSSTQLELVILPSDRTSSGIIFNPAPAQSSTGSSPASSSSAPPATSFPSFHSAPSAPPAPPVPPVLPPIPPDKTPIQAPLQKEKDNGNNKNGKNGKNDKKEIRENDDEKKKLKKTLREEKRTEKEKQRAEKKKLREEKRMEKEKQQAEKKKLKNELREKDKQKESNGKNGENGNGKIKKILENNDEKKPLKTGKLKKIAEGEIEAPSVKTIQNAIKEKKKLKTTFRQENKTKTVQTFLQHQPLQALRSSPILVPQEEVDSLSGFLTQNNDSEVVFISIHSPEIWYGTQISDEEGFWTWQIPNTLSEGLHQIDMSIVNPDTSSMSSEVYDIQVIDDKEAANVETSVQNIKTTETEDTKYLTLFSTLASEEEPIVPGAEVSLLMYVDAEGWDLPMTALLTAQWEDPEQRVIETSTESVPITEGTLFEIPFSIEPDAAPGLYPIRLTLKKENAMASFDTSIMVERKRGQFESITFIFVMIIMVSVIAFTKRKALGFCSS